MAHTNRGTRRGAGRKAAANKARNEKTTDAVAILHSKVINGSKRRLAQLALEQQRADIAQQIYDLRHQAGLTQKQFADLLNTTASVISRLEDADYDGYTLRTLNRIAAALHHRLEVNFVPA